MNRSMSAACERSNPVVVVTWTPSDVDDAFIEATVPNGGRSVSSRWCHMLADTREELDAMALAIGLRPQWIQRPGTAFEHYDLTTSRRAAALRAGAIAITWRESAQLTERKRLQS